MHDDARAQAQEGVEFAHPGRVARGQVVVDRDHVHALAGQRIEHNSQGGDQGFAFAGLHLGDLALVQDHAADELHVVMAHAQHTARCLAHQGENFGQKAVQAFAAFLHFFFIPGDAGGEVRVVQLLHFGFQGIDTLHLGAEAAQIPFVLAAEYFFEKKAEHGCSSASHGRAVRGTGELRVRLEWTAGRSHCRGIS